MHFKTRISLVILLLACIATTFGKPKGIWKGHPTEKNHSHSIERKDGKVFYICWRTVPRGHICETEIWSHGRQIGRSVFISALITPPQQQPTPTPTPRPITVIRGIDRKNEPSQGKTEQTKVQPKVIHVAQPKKPADR